MNAQVAQPIKTRADWLAERRTGIGGSDVAAILGMSKWRTPLDVYRDKVGEADEQPDNDAMQWGRILEPVVRQQYATLTGDSVLLAEPNTIIRHPVNSWMIASVDGYLIDDEGRPLGVLECKTARTADGWGLEWTADVPDYYALQVQHYMCVTGLEFARVAVLIGGSDFRIYHVPRDEPTIDLLVQAEGEFWHEHVERGIPPDPRSDAEAAAIYRRVAAAGEVKATDDILAVVETLRTAKERVTEWEVIVEDARAKLQAFMQDRETLVGADGKTLATWKLAKAPERFDTRAFKAAHPTLAAQFTVAGEPSRRFLVK